MKFSDYISNVFAVVSGVFGVIVAYPVFHNKIGTFIVAIIFGIIGYTQGIKILTGLGGPTLRIWLITGDIGIDFLNLALQIFQTNKLVSKDEIYKIKIYMTKEFGHEIGIEAENYIIKNYKKKINIKKVCHNYIRMKHTYRLNLFHQLFGITASDGSITDKEEHLLMVIAKHLRIGKRSYKYVKNSFIKEEKTSSTTNKNEKKSTYKKNQNKNYNKNRKFNDNFFSKSINAYIILGIDKNASVTEVKKAYRKLVKLYHPDKILNKSKLYKKRAKERFNEINDSYDYIMKQVLFEN